MEQIAIPLAALTVSITTLIITGMSLRRKADGDYVQQLEARVSLLEKSNKECEHDRNALRSENIALMQKLLK